MTIEKINGISEILKPQKVKHAENVAKTKDGDKVNLSEEAKKLAELEKFTEIVRNSPDMRSEKVKEAKERMMAGNNITKEVAEQIAAKIIQSLGIK